MFAYCGNNPVMCSDPTGTKRKIWFQLFQDHDPGYLHRAVQVHILTTKNIEAVVYQSEYYMAGVGRADIVSLRTGEMWEIKYGGSGADAYLNGIDSATAQLDRYISKGSTLKKGRANTFSGSFTVGVGSLNYFVSYSTPKEGVILYNVSRMNEVQTKPDFVYVPHTLYKEQKTMVSMVAFAFVGGALEPFPQQEQLLGS